MDVWGECEMNSLIADRNLPDIQLKEKLFQVKVWLSKKRKAKNFFEPYPKNISWVTSKFVQHKASK